MSHFQSNLHHDEYVREVKQEPVHPTREKTASGKPEWSLSTHGGAWRGASECSRSPAHAHPLTLTHSHEGPRTSPPRGASLSEHSPKCFRTKQKRAEVNKLKLPFPQQPATLSRGNHYSRSGQGSCQGVDTHVWHMYSYTNGSDSTVLVPCFSAPW